MTVLVEGPVPYLDETSEGEERLAVSGCGFGMLLDRDGIPLDRITAVAFLTRCLYGLPCHDDPLLYQAGSGERWRNAVGWLEPDTSGRAPIDAWPTWYLDMALLDVL